MCIRCTTTSACRNLTEYSPLFVRSGYRQLIDLVHLEEKDVRRAPSASPKGKPREGRTARETGEV